MKITILIINIIFFGLLSHVANANTLNFNSKYFVRIHFGSNYHGAAIRSVSAHVGLVSNNYWFSIQDIELDFMNDHFYGKAQLESSSNHDNYLDENLQIAYLVRLKDGRQIWTDPSIVSILDRQTINLTCSEQLLNCQLPNQLINLIGNFNMENSSEKTFATYLQTIIKY